MLKIRPVDVSSFYQVFSIHLLIVNVSALFCEKLSDCNENYKVVCTRKILCVTSNLAYIYLGPRLNFQYNLKSLSLSTCTISGTYNIFTNTWY